MDWKQFPVKQYSDLGTCNIKSLFQCHLFTLPVTKTLEKSCNFLDFHISDLTKTWVSATLFYTPLLFPAAKLQDMRRNLFISSKHQNCGFSWQRHLEQKLNKRGTLRQHWGENLPEVICARKIQKQTLSEPLFPESHYTACSHMLQIQNTHNVYKDLYKSIFNPTSQIKYLNPNKRSSVLS